MKRLGVSTEQLEDSDALSVQFWLIAEDGRVEVGRVRFEISERRTLLTMGVTSDSVRQMVETEQMAQWRRKL